MCVTRPLSITAALFATVRPDGVGGRRSGKPTTTAARDVAVAALNGAHQAALEAYLANTDASAASRQS